MTTDSTLSRRKFLAAAGMAAAGAAFGGRLAHAAGGVPSGAEWELTRGRGGTGLEWGRITAWTPVRKNTLPADDLTSQLREGEVVPLLGIVEGTAPDWNPNNNRWYRVRDGFIYTATVQQISPYRMPRQLDTMPETLIDEEPGFWVEVIVPETLARTEPSGPAVTDDQGQAVRLIYSSIHRVIDIEADAGGYLWYKIWDDKPKAEPFYGLARHLRVIEPEEYAPINPGAADKHLRVDLTGQRIECYEGDTLVFWTLMSSGTEGYPTPPGEWSVVYKQPSRHMYSGDDSGVSGGDADADAFDLPGVPFNTFFTTMGHAIHGTWWHGDYGRPRSHGCLNVPSPAAKFIWRWVEPHGGYSDLASGSSREPGTPVLVE